MSNCFLLVERNNSKTFSLIVASFCRNFTKLFPPEKNDELFFRCLSWDYSFKKEFFHPREKISFGLVKEKKTTTNISFTWQFLIQNVGSSRNRCSRRLAAPKQLVRHRWEMKQVIDHSCSVDDAKGQWKSVTHIAACTVRRNNDSVLNNHLYRFFKFSVVGQKVFIRWRKGKFEFWNLSILVQPFFICRKEQLKNIFFNCCIFLQKIPQKLFPPEKNGELFFRCFWWDYSFKKEFFETYFGRKKILLRQTKKFFNWLAKSERARIILFLTYKSRKFQACWQVFKSSPSKELFSHKLRNLNHLLWFLIASFHTSLVVWCLWQKVFVLVLSCFSSI